MEEIWKAIPGYENYYEASTLGRIRSVGKRVEKINHGTPCVAVYQPQILAQHYHPAGYLLVNLNKGNNQHSERVHRLVAITFLENPENKPFINHKNGIKDDNRLENLEWCTPQENSVHAYSTGLVKRWGPSIPVAQMNDNGDILNVYPSANAAARAIGKSTQCGRNIRSVCYKGYGHCGGYCWKQISQEEYEQLK
jgi:hypothetical protein